jgi:hypothetical protein
MALANRQVPGMHDGSGAAAPVPYEVASASGAVLLSDGVVMITKAGVAVLTIADPPAEGVHPLTLVSTGAHAHTLTNTTGFAAAGGSGDVATWGGAVNDSLQLVGYLGVWHVVASRNVSIG